VAQDRVNKFVESLRGGNHRLPYRTSNQVRAALRKCQRVASSRPLTQFRSKSAREARSLRAIAKTVVDGALSGKHRSTHKGGCTDFAEFRPYARAMMSAC